MDVHSGESKEEEVTGEGKGESEIEERVAEWSCCQCVLTVVCAILFLSYKLLSILRQDKGKIKT